LVLLPSHASPKKQGDCLRELKATGYACGLGLMIMGLGLYSYYLRDLLASLVLFTVAFFFLGLVVLGGVFAWCASIQVTNWIRSASRSVIAFSRRLITAYARS
jgi:hypothetical protein